MNISDDRAEVRRAGRDARRAVQGYERERAEHSLVGHLRSLHLLRAPTVGVFVAHDGEPELAPLVKWLWASGRTVALPVLEEDPNDFSMRFVPWQQGDALERGRYDIPVPPAQPSIVPATLLVSLTGFDVLGNRIGRGAGFFDRYLASATSAIVGVGFEAQRFDRIPIEDHDQPLPIVVTDLGVRYFE